MAAIENGLALEKETHPLQMEMKIKLWKKQTNKQTNKAKEINKNKTKPKVDTKNGLSEHRLTLCAPAVKHISIPSLLPLRFVGTISITLSQGLRQLRASCSQET